MPMNSVNTNVGAMVALQNLNATQSDLATTQSRINTGLKVASAKDDGSIWAIAQNQRATSGSLDSVKDSLQRASSTVDVAISAGASLSDLLLQMKQKVGDAFTSRQRHVHGGRGALQRVFHGIERAGRRALVLGDGPDGAVVLRAGDLQAGVDPALGVHQVVLGGAEVLQRGHGADIGIDAIQRHYDEFLFSGTGVVLTAGGFLPGSLCSKAGANPAALAGRRQAPDKTGL